MTTRGGSCAEGADKFEREKRIVSIRAMGETLRARETGCAVKFQGVKK